MEVSEYLSTVESMHKEARARGLFFQIPRDEELRGTSITLAERPVRAFTSCSYLGLERHPALVAGVHDAVDRFGTQFASSRGYISCPLYEEFEANLSAIFGHFALPVPTTTLGHQIALGVLATEKDAIVLDHQSHHSVQMAVTLSRANGAHVELVRHSELGESDATIARLACKHRTVWIACDGVYSMYGDLAPVHTLKRLLKIAPNVRLYVDDAHGMSWAGEHGRGSFLSRLPLSPQIVVCTSLCKGFGAGGATLVFADRDERERVRMCGGPMVFSGPMQPPMIGAANASAKLHLSDEIVSLQRDLSERVALCNSRMRDVGLPLLVENEAPIFFVRLGLPEIAFQVAQRMLDRGVYVNISMYPTVPMKRAGIRLALTTMHSLDDVFEVVDLLATCADEVLRDNGVSRDQLDSMFERALPIDSSSASMPPRGSNRENAVGEERHSGIVERMTTVELSVERFKSIHEIDRALWDSHMGDIAACSWDAMALVERVFTVETAAPEHRWEFDYVIVRDRDGTLMAMTFFTTVLIKDDMLSRDVVSRAVEARRAEEPYFLTSRATMMGSMFSEGNHLWVNRAGPWQSAVSRVLAIGENIHDERGAALLMLRDLPGDDEAMDALMLREGFVKVPMYASHSVVVDWSGDQGIVARARKRSRALVRQLIADGSSFERRVWRGNGVAAQAVEDPDHLFRLYQNVANRKLKLNVFPFPKTLIPELFASNAWEVVTLSIRQGGTSLTAPVAWYAAHVHGHIYSPFFCGLDYDYVTSHGAYRQMLLAMLRRGCESGMRRVRLGMDADVEKGRFGTEVQQNCVYVRISDHFNGELLREVIADVAVGRH